MGRWGSPGEMLEHDHHAVTDLFVPVTRLRAALASPFDGTSTLIKAALTDGPPQAILFTRLLAILHLDVRDVPGNLPESCVVRW